jgi:hypothetical protein
MQHRWGIAICVLASFAAPTATASEPLCGGVAVPIDASVSGKPFVNLTLGGVNGNFLLDLGATGSLVDAARYGAARGAEVTLSGFSLPTVQDGEFSAADLQPFAAPPGGELGVVGTDFLSLRSIVFHYAEPHPFVAIASDACDPAALRRASFAQVGLPGYYAADLRQLKHDVPNVPVIGLRIGQVAFPTQVDTGLGDFPRGIVQINTPLFDALSRAGMPMHKVPSTVVTVGCSGSRAYERWQIERDELVIVTPGGDIVATYPPPLLEVKADTGCGGISEFTEPFGQIGASWLAEWGESVFDGPSSQVWIPLRR